MTLNKICTVFILLNVFNQCNSFFVKPGVRRLGFAITASSKDAGPEWTLSSWRKMPIAQPPQYPDEAEVDKVVGELSNCAPLVFAGEVRTLQEELARASMAQGFLLMGGDCAESFSEFSVNHIRDTFRILLQMALIMTFGGSMPVIKIGRMAGQFAKPRSEPDEVRDGVTLPSYRGDILNGDEFTAESRTHNPRCEGKIEIFVF